MCSVTPTRVRLGQLAKGAPVAGPGAGAAAMERSHAGPGLCGARRGGGQAYNKYVVHVLPGGRPFSILSKHVRVYKAHARTLKLGGWEISLSNRNTEKAEVRRDGSAGGTTAHLTSVGAPPPLDAPLVRSSCAQEMGDEAVVQRRTVARALRGSNLRRRRQQQEQHNSGTQQHQPVPATAWSTPPIATAA